jgi:hypothetical protein
MATPMAKAMAKAIVLWHCVCVAVRRQWIAVLTLIVTGLGSYVVYLVYTDQRDDQKIAAAIQLSQDSFGGATFRLRNFYYQQVRMTPEAYDKMLSMQNGKDLEFDIEMLNASSAYLQYLDYLAKLINDDKVNPDYISDELKCNITEWSKLAFPPNRDRSYGLPKPEQLRNVNIFREKNPKLRCERYVP